MSLQDFLLRFITYIPIQVGSKAPRLSLTAHDGTWVRSEDFFEEALFILFFFPSFSNPKTEYYLQQIEILDQEIHRIHNLNAKNIESKTKSKKKKNYSEQSTPVSLFAVTDQNITILREEVKKRALNYKILYDPLSLESRRFGLSHRRLKCAFGYILIDKAGICVEYQRGIPDFDNLLQSLIRRTLRKTDVDGNTSDDELLVGYINSKIAEEKVRESYRIIDVRTLPEYEADHIPNAIHIPLDDLHNRHAELDPLKELLFVCQTGTRATAGAEFITSIGGQSIFVIQGGMSEWNGERITGGKS